MTALKVDNQIFEPSSFQITCSYSQIVFLKLRKFLMVNNPTSMQVMAVGDSNLETAQVGDTKVEHRNLENGVQQNDSAKDITRDGMHIELSNLTIFPTALSNWKFQLHSYHLELCCWQSHFVSHLFLDFGVRLKC